MSWKIAVCEDEKIYSDRIEKLIIEWSKESGTQISITHFDNALKLLGAWEDTSSFDAFLLDIEMPGGMDGMAFAEAVRKVDDAVPIVFVTSHNELIHKGYPLEALDYLIKPLQKESFFSTMDRLIKRLDQLATRYFVCKIEGEFRRIRARHIYFFTSEGHYVTINYSDEWRFREKMDDVQKRLSSSFARIHQSTIVNLEHIHQFHPNYVVMDDKDRTELPISRRYQSEFLESYHAYYRFF